MKIVDRKAFLTMPRGTLFVKIKPCIVEPLMLLAGAAGSNDFVYREIVEIDSHDSGQFADMIFDACEHKTRDTLPLDWDTDIHRDGLFDEDQMFGVLERDEVASLITMLTKAYNDSFPAEEINLSSEDDLDLSAHKYELPDQWLRDTPPTIVYEEDLRGLDYDAAIAKAKELCNGACLTCNFKESNSEWSLEFHGPSMRRFDFIQTPFVKVVAQVRKSVYRQIKTDSDNGKYYGITLERA